MILKNCIISTLFVFFYSFLSGQSYWEYFNKEIGENEQIFFAEENNEGNIVSTGIVHNSSDENKWYSFVRIHNGKTGKVEKEKIYKIDSLSTKLRWIFTNETKDTFTIIGPANNKQEQFRRGYFLITQWDSNLNLLKDTIIRIEPIDQNIYLWHIYGSYTQNHEFLVFGHVRGSLDGYPYDGQQIYLRIDKNGDILKKKWKKESIYFAGQSSFIELKNNNYLLIGTESFILDNNFEEVDSAFFFNTKTHIPLFHSSSRLVSEDSILIFVENEANQCPGLGIFDTHLNLKKKVNICKSNYSFETGNTNLCFDYADPNSIFISSKDVYFDYYTLAKVNFDLDILWVKYFNNNADLGQNLNSIKATSDGGCILVGSEGFHLNQDYNLYSFGSWMKKFDSEGNTVSTQEPGHDTWEITVFPNPSSGDFRIEIAGDADENMLLLYDLEGKEVKRYQNLTVGTNTFQFDDIPAGIYIWKLMNKGREIGEGKWVKTGL